MAETVRATAETNPPAHDAAASASVATPPATPSISLDVIQIASACPADWNDMTGDDHARHCDECQLNVYNLSGMSTDEAQMLINSHEGRLCVRFFRRADGTMLTADCPVGFRDKARRAERWARMRLAAATLMLAGILQVGCDSNASASPNKHQRTPVTDTVSHIYDLLRMAILGQPEPTNAPPHQQIDELGLMMVDSGDF